MQDSFANQAISEIPGILAKFLEIPEEQVSFPKIKEDYGYKLVVNEGKYTFIVECKISSAKASLLSAFMQFEENMRASGGVENFPYLNLIELILFHKARDEGLHTFVSILCICVPLIIERITPFFFAYTL